MRFSHVVAVVITTTAAFLTTSVWTRPTTGLADGGKSNRARQRHRSFAQTVIGVKF